MGKTMELIKQENNPILNTILEMYNNGTVIPEDAALLLKSLLKKIKFDDFTIQIRKRGSRAKYPNDKFPGDDGYYKIIVNRRKA